MSPGRFVMCSTAREDAEAGSRHLQQIYPNIPLANGFLHGAPGFSFVVPEQAVE
jgi:hypothetical protein